MNEKIWDKKSKCYVYVCWDCQEEQAVPFSCSCEELDYGHYDIPPNACSLGESMSNGRGE